MYQRVMHYNGSNARGSWSGTHTGTRWYAAEVWGFVQSLNRTFMITAVVMITFSGCGSVPPQSTEVPTSLVKVPIQGSIERIHVYTRVETFGEGTEFVGNRQVTRKIQFSNDARKALFLESVLQNSHLNSSTIAWRMRTSEGKSYDVVSTIRGGKFSRYGDFLEGNKPYGPEFFWNESIDGFARALADAMKRSKATSEQAKPRLALVVWAGSVSPPLVAINSTAVLDAVYEFYDLDSRKLLSRVDVSSTGEAGLTEHFIGTLRFFIALRRAMESNVSEFTRKFSCCTIQALELVK